ncbi:Hydrogenase expression/formation protein HypE [archaeon HR01]|nr:Hydrogenase expression/formation protein HypE [archaeon HR01]
MSKISLAHGSGGVETQRLLERLVINRLPAWMKKVENGLGLDFPDDAAAIPVKNGYLVSTIDAYTVSPIFFPGGDLGKLAAAGTINDLLMLGARPLAVLDAIIVEEGTAMDDLARLVDSMIAVLRGEGVCLIGGDIKVMPKGQLDGVLITTAGLGFASKLIVDNNIKPGDKIIATGPLGVHGAAIFAAQQRIFSHEFRSDVKPLTKILLPLIERYIEGIHAARDPTRGGAAMVLNDWARGSDVMLVVYESELPLPEPVVNLCEMLGVDPMTLASEGAALLAVSPEIVNDVLNTLYENGCGEARVIGEAREKASSIGVVVLKTLVGGARILEPPSGEIVPRIC